MSITRDSKEVKDFASLFHYGTLGIEKTSQDLRADIQKVRDSGYSFKAFNCEMIHAPLAIQLLEGRMRVHVPISYPLGNMTLNKKFLDLEYCAKIGVDEDCVCLNFGAIVSHRYDLIEEEVRTLVDRFEGPLELAFVIQATLLNDPEIIEVCKAIANGGGTRIKVNTGYGWGTSPEEVALIRRVFGYAFDIHASGNIRLACFDIIDEYIARRNASVEFEN